MIVVALCFPWRIYHFFHVGFFVFYKLYSHTRCRKVSTFIAYTCYQMKFIYIYAAHDISGKNILFIHIGRATRLYFRI